MGLEYIIEPKKLDVDQRTVLTVAPGEAEFYGVYARGVKAPWGIGGTDPDAEHLANHIRDFPDQVSAQAFVERLRVTNWAQIEAVERNEPVTVAGVHYLPEHDANGRLYYSAEGNLAAGYETAKIQPEEMDCYLKTGQLSPELAANARKNMAKLDDFEQENLKHHAAERSDPLQYLIGLRTQAGGLEQYGVVLHGSDTYWHHTVGPHFDIDLGNWPTHQEAQAFIQHLVDNGPAFRKRDVEYVVVNESLLGYRAPPDKDATFSTVQVLFEPGRGLLNNQKPVQHGLDQVRPATRMDFEHFRVHFDGYEKDLTRPLEALARNYPVMVAGTLYHPLAGCKPTTPESAMRYYAAGKDDLLNGRMAPRVAGWEIWQYLVSGKLTPQLAENAVKNLHKLDVFDRASMMNFAKEAKNDPNFNQFRLYETAYRSMSDAITQGGPIRDFGLKDMSLGLNEFVRNPRFEEAVTNEVAVPVMSRRI